jgi:hypothetical protein
MAWSFSPCEMMAVTGRYSFWPVCSLNARTWVPRVMAEMARRPALVGTLVSGEEEKG